MKQRIFLIMAGSCIGIGVFLYSVFMWYSSVLVASQTSLKETVGAVKEQTLLSSLPFTDKLGQVFMIGFEGTEVTPEVSSLFSSIRPGGVLLLGRNIVNKEQTRQLVAGLQEISMRTTGLPLFVAVDQEGGMVSRVPWAESTGASRLKNSDEALLVGAKRARDLKEIGVNVNLAPVLDSNEQGDFLFNRSFQKDQRSSLAIAQSLILGHAQEGVIAVPKHFPGYDSVSFNPENGVLPAAKNFPDISLFKEVFHDSQIPFVMLSHVVYRAVDPDNPLPLSQKGMDLARKELGDRVLFISDDLASKSLMGHYSLGEIGKAALSSGVNVLLLGGYPNPSVVEEFYESMQDELAKEQPSYGAAAAGGLYEILSGMIEANGELHKRVEESADKIIKLKQDMIR